MPSQTCPINLNLPCLKWQVLEATALLHLLSLLIWYSQCQAKPAHLIWTCPPLTTANGNNSRTGQHRLGDANKIHKRGGGGSIGFHKTLFFSQNLKRPLFTVFVGRIQWIVQVWALKTWETLEFEPEIPKTQLLSWKSQHTCIFVAKITKYALLSQKSQHRRSFVAKIIICIRSLLLGKSQHISTLVEREKK